jgi:hypothetical protein
VKFYFPSGLEYITSTCNACESFLADQFTGVLNNKKHQCTNCGELHEVQVADSGMGYTNVIFKKNMPSWYEKYPSVEIVE